MIERIIIGMLLLIAIYLFVINASGTERVMKSLATGSVGLIEALQGR